MASGRWVSALALVALNFGAGHKTPAAQNLAGIAHVAFRVTDVEKSKQFYSSLGFEEAFEFADPGKPRVSYIKINDQQFIELYGRAGDSQPIGLMHVCFEAADIEALRKEYARRGVIAPESKKARAGNLLFSIHDPNGQSVEFTQYLPGSLHSEDRGKHLGERRISEHLVWVIVPVQDLSATRNFYTNKLGFGDASIDTAIRLRLPGRSREALGLDGASAAPKPRIGFAISDLERAKKDLWSRGFEVRSTRVSAAVLDPDGTVVEFTPDRLGAR